MSCLTAVFHNHDFARNASMIVGELLENALKYGDWSQPGRSEFMLRVRGSDHGVHIEVCNPVGPESAAAAQLLGTLDWLRSFPDRRKAYEARLRAVASSAAGDASGLGLARIAYEGDCELEASISDEGVLRVRATTPTPGSATSPATRS